MTGATMEEKKYMEKFVKIFMKNPESNFFNPGGIQLK